MRDLRLWSIGILSLVYSVFRKILEMWVGNEYVDFVNWASDRQGLG